MNESNDQPRFPLRVARAYQGLGIAGEFKLSSDDFRVDEILAFEPEGEGEHVFIQVEKKALTTEHVIADIHRMTGINKRDIAYSGLKDKLAVTTQWLSFPWPIKKDMPTFDAHNWTVLRQCRHQRKLKRGVHQGNRFCIVLRHLKGDLSTLAERMELIKAQGVPNYFGLQRFGHQGRNVDKALALFNGEFKVKKFQRGLYYSAARSFLFNRYLSSRVEAGTWDKAIEGDVFQLQGSHSVFGPEPICDKIQQRIKTGDIHPTGSMPGVGSSLQQGLAAELMQSVLTDYEALSQGLNRAAIKVMLRSLRLMPEDLDYHLQDDVLTLNFTLPSGAFATAVLHEIADINGETW